MGVGDSDPSPTLRQPLTELVDELRAEAQSVLDELSRDGIGEIKLIHEHLHDAVGQLVYDRTRRRPMILPVVIEV